MILEKKETMAFDWAWEDGTPKDERAFKIVQSSPTLFFPELNDERVPTWAIEFASALMRRPLEFWYDQFLAKPPGTSVPTRWHQDEGYWGRNLDERGITCWMPMHDVDETNGCMHFIDGGHKRRRARAPAACPACRATCSTASPTSRAGSCARCRKGGVTFHHSKTPHMTNANTSDAWRRVLDAAPARRRQPRARATTTRGRSTSTSSPANASHRRPAER